MNYYVIEITSDSADNNDGRNIILASDEKSAEHIAKAMPGVIEISDAMPAMAFVSRHKPGTEQYELARLMGYELYHVGDANAFDCKAVRKLCEGFSAVCAVHPAVLLHLIKINGPVLAVFENETRAQENGPPLFSVCGLHQWKVYGAQEYDDEGAYEYADTIYKKFVV